MWTMPDSLPGYDSWKTQSPYEDDMEPEDLSLYVGIDPGQSGAIAVLSGTGDIRLLTKMPETPGDVWDEIEYIGTMARRDNIGVFIYLEKVGAMPGQGIASTAKFMRGYGVLIGCLAASGLPHDLVAPGVWQKRMKCLSKGDKNVTKRMAQQLFPTQKITHVTADALLIASYCRLTMAGHVYKYSTNRWILAEGHDDQPSRPT